MDKGVTMVMAGRPDKKEGELCQMKDEAIRTSREEGVSLLDWRGNMVYFRHSLVKSRM
eukprot:gnl/Chilomastix_caulleri/6484.p4 GENE.gnl/Chilomastix_caulleri/6484~~gnl/Chilomastix_caulleri/6484.p4  ORF type:complete len:58 (-),score=7.84 gnl/Chilomastix_caulleri/6484:27-200(-)